MLVNVMTGVEIIEVLSLQLLTIISSTELYGSYAFYCNLLSFKNLYIYILLFIISIISLMFLNVTKFLIFLIFQKSK